MLRRLLVLGIFLSAIVFAQTAPKPQPSAATPNAAEFVAANFGPAFSIVEKFPTIVGDVDGDGNEDVIFVLTRKDNPLVDQEKFHYKVIDPYDEYFGWGDPKVTYAFNAHDPELVKFIAIVHDWRAATPKAKYLVINLPFEKLSLGHVPVKKKTVVGIAAEELGGLTSAIYWDGKKYKWDATGAPE